MQNSTKPLFAAQNILLATHNHSQSLNTTKTFTSDTFIFTNRSPLHPLGHHYMQQNITVSFILPPSPSLPPICIHRPRPAENWIVKCKTGRLCGNPKLAPRSRYLRIILTNCISLVCCVFLRHISFVTQFPLKLSIIIRYLDHKSYKPHGTSYMLKETPKCPQTPQMSF